jgi:hypothetical protein
MILHAIKNIVKVLLSLSVLIGCNGKDKGRIEIEKNREGEDIKNSIPLERITKEEFLKTTCEEFEELKKNKNSDNNLHRK